MRYFRVTAILLSIAFLLPGPALGQASGKSTPQSGKTTSTTYERTKGQQYEKPLNQGLPASTDKAPASRPAKKSQAVLSSNPEKKSKKRSKSKDPAAESNLGSQIGPQSPPVSLGSGGSKKTSK